jgi:pimeloyl-ACP methyl ester carboxylesterase
MNVTDEFKQAQERLLARFRVRAESRFLEVSGVSGPVHVLVAGEGPPVVMVPGFGDPAAMWAPLMAKLDGFRVYAVDRPCFGLSGCARHDTATIRRLAVTFLEQVLDALRLEEPLFVANSIGSLWTIWLAIDRPHRVAAMTHVGCPAFMLGTSAPLPMRLLSIPPVGRLLMRVSPPSPRQVERFAAMVGADLSGLPELADLLVVMQTLPGVQPALLELLHAVIRLRGPRPEVELTASQLMQVAQPVQLIWGERDPFGAPSIGQEAARFIRHATYHVMPNAGHVPWVNDPAGVASVAVPFLLTQQTDETSHEARTPS